MSEKNKALAREVMAALDRNGGPVETYYTADTKTYMGDTPIDMQTYKRFVAEAFVSFPDLAHNIDEVTAEGDRVVLQITVTATHKATAFGIPATGKSVSYPSMVTYKIRDGKIAETRAVFDSLSLMSQLGVKSLPE